MRRVISHLERCQKKVLPRCFLYVIGVSFSIVASAAVVTFSQFVATGETICVRGAPVWPFSAATGAAATGAVIFAPPVLALGPLQLVGELLDGGGERQVGVGELDDCLDQALYCVIFRRGRHGQGVK